MGVNTLAFRVAQNNAFFGADEDCVGITGAIDWSLNREWLRALSLSASSLFVSCKPGILNEEETKELKEAFKVASVQKDEFIPLDWMETTCPEKYLINGKEVTFSWYPKNGIELPIK
jgi:alpha-galactosidase